MLEGVCFTQVLLAKLLSCQVSSLLLPLILPLAPQDWLCALRFAPTPFAACFPGKLDQSKNCRLKKLV